MSIQIENDGDIDIRQGDYDQKQPWGIRLREAEIVERLKVVNANSEYLKENVDPVADKDNLITFSKIILERGKFFVVEFQVLHDLTKRPKIETVGKITGIESIPIIAINLDANQPTFWRSVFWGDAVVQIVRVIVHVLGTIALLVAVISVLLTISERRNKSEAKRKKKLQDEYLKPLIDGKGSDDQKVIEYLFAATGGEVERLDKLLEILDSKERLEKHSAILRACAQLKWVKGKTSTGLFQYYFRYPTLIVEKDEATWELRVKSGTIELIRELATYEKATPPDKELLKVLHIDDPPFILA